MPKMPSGPSRVAPQSPEKPEPNEPGKLIEKVIDFDGGFRIETTQDTEPTMEAVHSHARSRHQKSRDGSRYLGSVPLVVCQEWAKECGAALGTREFADYARKKMLTGEFQKFRVDVL